MKKSFFIFAILLLSLTATVSALTPIQLRINGIDLPFIQSAVVPDSMNEQFLKGVYYGMTSDLKNKQIIITHFKQSDNYTIALLSIEGNYYVVTYKHEGGIIDGALLLKYKDIILGCDFMNTRGNRMKAESPTFSLEEDKVSVTRNFVTYVNAYDKGGRIITEVGNITSSYNVDKTGKIYISDGFQHSKLIIAENSSVPGSHGGKTETESDRCRTLGPGMNVISFYTNPVSQENQETPKRLETLFKQFDDMLANVPKREVENVEKCLAELELSQKAMILRNPKQWLSWLNKNPDSRSMKALNKSLELSQDFKSELLQQVKSLKDKKLRNAWKKRLNGR